MSFPFKPDHLTDPKIVDLFLDVKDLGVTFRKSPLKWWMTCKRTILVGKNSGDPWCWPDVIAHELVHVRQQRDVWFPWWVACYYASRSFRWRMERAAMLVQIKDWGYSVEACVAAIASYHCVKPEVATKWFEEQL